MKYKVKRRIEGSVSVMMVIILLVTMVFSALIVDTSRINMARSMVSSAGDLAVNSALANYDTVLKDVYGLFAMSQAQSSEELNQEIREYFEKTLVSYGVTSEAEAGDYVAELMNGVSDLLAGTGSMEVSNFLDMEVAPDFAATKVAASGLDNPEILRKQIVDYMKYRAPMNFGLSFLDSVKAFTTINDQTEVVQAQVEAQESLQPVTQWCRTVINRIREYDSRVQAIDTGDQAVVGRESSADPATVGIREYHEQLDKYRQDWGENYEKINKLAMVFLLKPPTVSDRYLSSMSISANEHFIHNDTLEVNKSGISVEVELAETCEAAENQVVSQREKLTDNMQPNSYLNLQQSYRNADFLPEANINYGHTDYTVQENAISAFIRYEAFLLNDADRAPITYSKTAEILEQLCILKEYQDNYLTLMGRDITELTAERDAKEEEMNRKQQEVEQAQNALDNAENAKKEAESKKSAWESAVSASSAAQAKVTEAQNALNSYAGKKNTEKYSSLKAALEAANTAYNEAKTAEGNAKDAYDSAKAAVPSMEQMFLLGSVLLAKQAEYGKIQLDYTALKDKVDLLEAKKNNHITKYKDTIDKYLEFANAYQRDQEWYVIYQEIAQKVITREATAIQAQALKIQENVKMLTEDLDKIEEGLEKLRQHVEEYDAMVGAWASKNSDYVTNNSTDTFSTQNEADIAATAGQYDLDSLNVLLSYVQSLKQIYDEFYKYITDSSHYKYGSKRVDAMATSEQILGAIPVNVKDALPELVTDGDAQGQFDTLYLEEHTPALDIQKATFLTDGVLPIQFLKYLNENFPVEEQKIQTGNMEEDPEQQYDDIKTQMKEEKEVKDEEPGEEGDPYGYTYRGHLIQNSDTLPSHKQDPDEDNKGNKANTSSMSITEDDGNVNASDSLGKQNESLGTVLGNVGAVLETGLENVYIMDYIFENFSYNTLIQEMVVEGETLENYSQVMGIASNDNLASYVGTARTLSNYNITGANNYLYGAEIEYILWGNVDPAKNVTFTKGSIYAIRFAFNSIFAFTNSEIRNTTRTVGLAVQAATAGFVPYQVVQVVLQLALAAAESAIDLDMMSKGLKVVVVKTKDTWSMSVSGAVGFMKDAATDMLEDKITDAIYTAIGYVDEGINAVLDASAEELGDAIDGLTKTLNNAAQSKGQEIIDSIYTKIQSEVDNLLNDLQFANYATLDGAMSKEEIEAQVDGFFETLKNKAEVIVSSYAGDPIADEILQTVGKGITGSNGVIEMLQRRIHSEIDKSYANTSDSPDVGSAICDAMLQIKCDVIAIMQDKLDEIEEEINRAAEKSIDQVNNEIKKYKEEYLDQLGEDLSEKAVAEVKDKVVGYLDDFTDTYLRDIEKSDLGIGGVKDMSASSNIASMIKFGYKDYLMLMLFISICVNDNAILGRIADLIQLNMQNATGQVDQEGQLVFSHSQKDTFTMAEAKTYVTVQGSVKVDMLFLNLDFFNRLLVEEGTDIHEQVNAVATIRYNGMSGY